MTSNREQAESSLACALGAMSGPMTREERATNAATAAHLAECVYWLRRDDREARIHEMTTRPKLTVTGPVER